MQANKSEFLDGLVKGCQENIWVIEIQRMEAQEKLAKKKAYLELIPKRMEEKFYPTARDGKEDLKQTQQYMEGMEANIARFNEGIELEKQKIEMIEKYRNQPEVSEE